MGDWKLVEILKIAFIPLLIITFSALSLCQLFNKKFYQTLPVVTISTIVILYIGYIFDYLFVGRIGVLISAAVLVILAVISIIKNKNFNKLLKENLLTPTMLIYVVLIVIFLFFAKDKLVGMWDELRLWAAYPKVLHTLGTNQIGENSMIFRSMQPYPPAMPLFCYFFTSFSTTFNESVLFFAYSIFGLVFLLPLTKYLDWSKWYYIVLAAFVIIFLPHIIYRYNEDSACYYQTLYIDCSLGIYFGYTFSRVREKIYDSKFKIYEFVLLLFCFGLLKDSGMFFAVMCLIASFANGYLTKGENKHKKFFVGAGISILAVWFSYFSWNQVIKIYETSTGAGMFSRLSEFSAINNLIQLVLDKKMYVAIIVGLAVFYAGFKLIYFKWDTGSTRAKVWRTVCQLICYIGFVLGYLLIFPLYISKFVFPSFRRYMGTILLAEIICFVFIVIDRFKDKDFIGRIAEKIASRKKNARHFAGIVFSILLVLLSVVLVNDFYKLEVDVYDKSFRIEQQIISVVDEDYSGNDEVVNVFFTDYIWSLIHHRVYFDLIDDKIAIKNFYDIMVIRHYDAPEFLDILKSGGYDYVYVLGSNKLTAEKYSQVFGEGFTKDTAEQMYKVVEDNGEIKLIPMK